MILLGRFETYGKCSNMQRFEARQEVVEAKALPTRTVSPFRAGKCVRTGRIKKMK